MPDKINKKITDESNQIKKSIIKLSDTTVKDNTTHQHKQKSTTKTLEDIKMENAIQNSRLNVLAKK